MASYKCCKCGNSYEYKQSLARHMKLKHSEEDHTHNADTDGDDNGDEGTQLYKKGDMNINFGNV